MADVSLVTSCQSLGLLGSKRYASFLIFVCEPCDYVSKTFW